METKNILGLHCYYFELTSNQKGINWNPKVRIYSCLCVVDGSQSIHSSRYSPHNHVDGDDSYNHLTTSVEQTKHSPHVDIITRNTTQSGDDSQLLRSQGSVTEKPVEVVILTDTDSEMSSDEQPDNTG